MDLMHDLMVVLAIFFVAGSPIWISLVFFWYLARQQRNERKQDKEYLDWLVGKRAKRNQPKE